MTLTPREEAMHLEIKALLFMDKPKDPEVQYIYDRACEEFFNTHRIEILNILDKHLDEKYKRR